MKYITQIIILFFSISSFSQVTIADLLKKHNTQSIPYISVQELAMPKTKAVILDARELIEYETSHIKNAIHVGYKNFNIETVSSIIMSKGEKIVVYCSLGIRSESIAKKLKKAGFNNVYNLYGGVFEWKNKGFNVYNSNGTETENVHVFSKEWNQWLTKGIKVYE